MTDMVGKVKVKGSKRATLALVLSLCTLGISGYLYYDGLKFRTYNNYQLQTLNNLIISDNQQQQQSLAQINNQVETLKNKITMLSTDKFSADSYQLNTLISLANQSIVAYHDINAAIKLLNYALAVTEANNNALYTELKVAIASDLEQLKHLPALDRVVIAAKLNRIIDSTEHLELLKKPVQIATDGQASNSYSKWQQFLLNIKDKLSGLVQVSSANKNDALNLLPQSAVIIHQNVKIDVLNARMALLQGDEANWQYSLTAAKQLLEVYFINNPAMNNTLAMLAELQQLNISYTTADIDQTLKALNKLNNVEK